MSAQHPIIAVTGSSGSGTSTFQHVFEKIFHRQALKSLIVHGNAFRRYTKDELPHIFKQAFDKGVPMSHFGPEANILDRLEGLFREYARTGTGITRQYIDNTIKAEQFQLDIGQYGPWTDIPLGTDILFYEGQHGGCVQSTWSRREMSASHNPFVIQERHKLKAAEDTGLDIARWVDLLIGVVPTINLEWLQKIHKDCSKTGCSAEHVTTTILRRLPDYVHFITPQFSLTDINFQRVPTVDTSYPFTYDEIPTKDESMTVIRFREPSKFDFSFLLNKIENAFMSRPNTMVVPGSEMDHAMELICEPLIIQLAQDKQLASLA